MGAYFPQAAMTLRIRWEDFGDSQVEKLKQVYVLPIRAKRTTVHINDYTQADTFECEIDYKYFPFDPRSIRACGVTIHMEDMARVFRSDNSLNMIKPSENNKMFIGFADEESISFNDTTRTVKMEGRDFTSLLLDRVYPKGTVDLQSRLDVVLQGLLNELEETKEIELDNRIEEELPILASFMSDKSELSGKKNVKRNEKYWEVIQDIVSRAGLIAYIELDKLVLTKPRALYKKSESKVFVYGKNIKDLQFKRKIGRQKGFNVAVRSLNIETKEVLEARIPAEATEAWANSLGISAIEIKNPQFKPDGSPVPEEELKPAPYITLRIPDVTNKQKLIEIGQEIYEEISRQQIEGSFKTREMEIRYNKINENGQETNANSLFNVLQLRNGTPLAVVIDQGDLEGFSRINSVAERANFLIQRGYQRSVAQVLAETHGKHSNIFYTRSVRFSVDSEDGFKAEVDFVNFIETSSKYGGAR